jgi:imidazole glycerol-phosphate synthase subunit HisH
MTLIIDYGLGNLRSVQKAFNRIGVDCYISNKPYEINKASKLLLPGVGHFSNGMAKLKENKLIEALNEAVLVKKTPILGICLGMQLMTAFSEEGNETGLGWVDAGTHRFNKSVQQLKIPHMGWNNLDIKEESLLFKGITSLDLFYFVHSYYISCSNENDETAKTTYGNTFISSFQHENIFGCQFHPEKSHDAGLRILKNFSSL